MEAALDRLAVLAGQFTPEGVITNNYCETVVNDLSLNEA